MITFNNSKAFDSVVCRAQDTQTSSSKVEYVEIDKIFFAHNHCSSLLIKEMKEALKARVYDAKTGNFKFKYAQGKSVFSEKESFPAVKTPFGYLIQDGNDEVLAASMLKSEKVPVHIIENVESMNQKYLWTYLKKHNYIYGNNISSPVQLGFPVDNPNYYFVQKTKAVADSNNRISGPERPLVLISKFSPRFTEAKIADYMTQNGINSKYFKGKPSLETLEKIQVLLSEKPINGVMSISKGMHIKNIHLVV